MPHFFINQEEIELNKLYIYDKQDINHIKNVLRSRIGAELILTNSDETTYRVVITEINKDKITTNIQEKLPFKRKTKYNIQLAQSILKSQAQDILVQKATELGVNKIKPITSKYTVVKLNTDKDKQQKAQRWQKIAYEACKQCERANIPEVMIPTTLKMFLEQDNNIKIACVEREAQLTLKVALEEIKPKVTIDDKLTIIVGPEGGWSNEEIQLFKDKQIPCVSLGNLILRAETAVIKALSNVIYELEE